MADAVDVLSQLALSLPEVEERIACAGTAIEQASFRTGGKAFLFAQRKGELAIVRLKLERSITAAEAGRNGLEAGKGGWATCRIPLAKAPTPALKRWVRASHALSASSKSPPRKKATKKPSPRSAGTPAQPKAAVRKRRRR